MMRWIVAISMAALLAPAVQGQGDPEAPIYEFELTGPTEPMFLPYGGSVAIDLTLADRSRDSTAGAGQEADAVPNLYGLRHRTTFTTSIQSVGDPEGWVVYDPAPLNTRGGEVKATPLVVMVSNTADIHSVVVSVHATTDTRNGPFNQSFSVEFYTDGLSGFSARPGVPPGTISPGDVVQTSILVTNPSLFPETYHMSLLANPCGLSVVPPASVTLPARTSNHEVFFSVRGASDRPWYFTEDCSIRIGVAPAALPSQEKTVPVSVVVNGGYMNPMWMFWTLAAAVAAFLVILFTRRRKEVIEEEILGKPQKPWTIPVERVYLEHLEAKDPRAAYVVRHFLMEEEYASALLWYKHYKQATRGERAKESMVVRQEKKYDRFKAGWEKKIAAPLVQADKFEARLQKRLDRIAKRTVRKERRKWKKLVAKLEKAVESQNEKLLAKWEKTAAKAEKKGKPVPPKPELLSPDLPPEPQLQKIHLADHKWNKKAQRFRKKMVKRQGDLEVKFEKKDARMLHRLRKKVHKIARKLDDPDFVDEHPLLAKAHDAR